VNTWGSFGDNAFEVGLKRALGSEKLSYGEGDAGRRGAAEERHPLHDLLELPEPYPQTPVAAARSGQA